MKNQNKKFRARKNIFRIFFKNIYIGLALEDKENIKKLEIF